MNSSQPPKENKIATIPSAAAILEDGSLAEMVYDAIKRQTQFVVGKKDDFRYEDKITLSPTERLVPYSATNNLLKHGVVLFPSEPEEYGTEADLVSQIRAFIREYVDMEEDFEELATYYALFSWVYDAFDEVPYVRVRGGYGSGKTRFLLTLGSICYRPIFASAASTVSPLFRLLDSFRGTLILDEGDFRYSDEKSEIVKILNNGNARGFPVLRTEVSRQREFDPRAYDVFGPKVIATRGFFQDKALESRCLTEDMRGGKLRGEVPLNLDDQHREQAQRLRNKLLLYRLRNYDRARAERRAADRDLEPRLEQIFGPLLSVIGDSAARERLVAAVRKFNEELVEERAESAEARILGVVRDLVARGPSERLAVQDIATEFTSRYGDEYGRRATPRWIGSILRRRLGLRTNRNTGLFVIGPEEITKLPELYRRYEVDSANKEVASDENAA
jgi:hypothetical protein